MLLEIETFCRQLKTHFALWNVVRIGKWQLEVIRGALNYNNLQEKKETRTCDSAIGFFDSIKPLWVTKEKCLEITKKVV